MATISPITIDPSHLPDASVSSFTKESATELANLMQENHEKNNVYFNDSGFHNHIAHHLLSIYALGATPAQLKHAYSRNSQYQRPLVPTHDVPQSRLHDPKIFMDAMSDVNNYSDFLNFFTAEVAQRGIAETVNEYFFKGDARAEAMYSRLFASILHPLIHLGLSLEFQIPAMVAEALAWTAVHKDEEGDFVREVEKAAATTSAPAQPASFLSLVKELQTDKIRNGILEDEAFKHGLLFTRERAAVIEIAAKYRISTSQLDVRVKELLNAVAYLIFSLQKPPHLPKLDFFSVHYLNATVFLPALAKRLAPAHAVRVIEDFARATLFFYACQRSSELRLDWPLAFAHDAEKRAKQGYGTDYPTWESVFESANNLNDDGHVSKAIRALKGAESVAGTQTEFKEELRKEQMLELAGVLMRSVEAEPDFVDIHGPTNQWVRGCGFVKSWEPIPTIDI